MIFIFKLQQKVDLGIADLSITYEREQAVDFSLPFMNTGRAVLMHLILFKFLIDSCNFY